MALDKQISLPGLTVVDLGSNISVCRLEQISVTTSCGTVEDLKC